MKSKFTFRLLPFLSLLMVIFQVNSMNAQGWGIIDSLKLIPVNPTSTGTIQVVCYSHFATGVCILLNSSVNINDTLITVNASHMQGGFAFICYSGDTTTLGSNFHPGNYIVPYNLSDSIMAAFDVDTLYFTIPETNGENENSFRAQIKIKPNPFHTSAELILTTALHISNAEMKIYDLSQREIKRKQISSDETIIAIENLSAGFYTFNIFIKGGIAASGKFVVQ